MIRDVISEFWQEFYETCTTGCVYKVPTTRHDMQEEEWRSVARILLKGWLDYGYFPVNLAPTFVEECLYGKPLTNTLEVFFNYLPQSESVTLKKACEDFESVEQDQLLDVLDSHHGRVLPTNENIKAVCYEIAGKELIQDPRFVVDTWKEVLAPLSKELTAADLQQLYKNSDPTTKKVLSLLKFPDVVSEGQADTVRFLKMFLKEIDQGVLKKFFLVQILS